MISIKGGTQTFSTAEQTSSFKPDVNKNLAAGDWEKAFGDKDIGEVLNKVADPNWVDPAKTRKVGNDQLGKDAFLKLLLAQLKNQDPTKPMESHEMAAQLAQFSSLEKLENIDTGIANMAKQADPKQKHSFEALNLLGKAIQGDSSKIIRSDVEENHDIKFKLMGDASKVSLKIKNINGDIVRTLELSSLKEGENMASWKGLNEEGSQMGVGEYKVEIEATNASGQKIGAQTKFSGVITGVNYGAEGPILMMGNQKVRIQDVKSILDPSLLAKTQKVEIDNKVAVNKGEVVNNKQSQLVDNVGMSREMLNKLNKETGK